MDIGRTSVPIDAISTPTAAICNVTAPIFGVIFATCATICASGALATRQGVWPISAATAAIFGSIEGTFDTTVAIGRRRITRPRRLEAAGPFPSMLARLLSVGVARAIAKSAGWLA